LAGCATIKGRAAKKPVTIQASKQGIDFELVDGKGNVIAKGQTPYQVELKPKAFNGVAAYLKFIDSEGKPAMQAIKGKFSPGIWLLWDTLGVATGLIVDAVTGAMWVLPSTVNMLGIAYNSGAGQQFFIATLDELQPELRKYLVPYDEWVLRRTNIVYR
jgi:hypothetical protein